MNTELKASRSGLYETDYLMWIQDTLEKLKDHNYDQVDWKNLLDEIEDMSRRERQALKSNLVVVLLHLLKWQYQPEGRTGSWKGSIREHRRRIREAIEDSPSLKSYPSEVLARCYEDAVGQASDETGLPIDAFPIECPYSIEDVLQTKLPND